MRHVAFDQTCRALNRWRLVIEGPDGRPDKLDERVLRQLLHGGHGNPCADRVLGRKTVDHIAMQLLPNTLEECVCDICDYVDLNLLAYCHRRVGALSQSEQLIL